jgi:hypothetical protein
MTGQDCRYERIRRRLHALRNHEKRVFIFTGILFASSISICFALLLLGAESLLWLSPPWKRSLLFIFGACFLAGWIRSVGVRLFSYWFLPNRPSDDMLAERIGRAFPEVKDRLLNAIQVFRYRRINEHRTSPILAEFAVERMASETEALDFDCSVSKTGLRRMLVLFFSVLLISLAACPLLYRDFLPAWDRLRHPARVFEKPIPYDLEFKPGSIRAVQGDTVLFSVEGRGSMPGEVCLFIQEGRKTSDKIVLHRPYRHRMASIQRSLTYHYTFESFRSRDFLIDVADRPELERLDVVVHPPSYTGMTRQVYERNLGHIEALKTSRVELSIRSSQENEKAWLEFQSGRKVALRTEGKQAAGRFDIERDDVYSIGIQNREGIANSHPILYSIRLVEDLAPSAVILSPEAELELDQSLDVPLLLEGRDDYGIEDARIAYARPALSREAPARADTAYFDLPLSGKRPTSFRAFHLWNVESLDLFPEDIVHYWLELTDNDALHGPKPGRSAVQTIRFPSIMEIVQKIDTEQKGQIDGLDTLFQADQAFQKNLEKFSDELKTGLPVPWERKMEMQSELEKQKHGQLEIEDISDRMESMLERIRSEDLLSRETMEKYSKLRDLIEELASPEINDRIKRLQDALNRTDRELMKMAAEALQIKQEDVLKALDRSIALFRRLLAEQKIEEQIERMREMARSQREVNDILRNDFRDGRSRASRQEARIIRSSEAFNADLPKLSDAFPESETMADSAFNRFLTEFKREKLAERLAKLSGNIESGQSAESVGSGESAAQSMEKLQKALENVRASFRNRLNDRLRGMLKQTSRRLMDLSAEQEALAQESLDHGINAGAVGKQNALISGLQQVSDSLEALSRVTLSIPPGIAGSLAEAMLSMSQSLEELEAGKRPESASSQTRSMGALNRSILEIQNAMGGMKGEGGSGLEGFFSGMEQLGREQMALHEKLMQMLEEARLSMEARAGMPKLGGEQESIRQRLERLVEQYPAASRLPGDFGGMEEEMEKAAQEMLQRRADNGTLQRQERIITRMLDSQRALREQDEGPRRRAKTGRNDVVRNSPLPAGIRSAGSERLRQRLLELSGDGYAPEYRAWIQRYFERLAREKL